MTSPDLSTTPQSTERRQGQKRQAWSSAHYEFAAVIASSFGVFVALINYDVAEWFHGWMLRHEELQVDEIFLTFVFLAIALWLFSYRRWREFQMVEMYLNDAIESLPSGFALFDAKDQLVICNENYRQTYPACASIMNPGTTFEEIIRTSVENGEIKEAGVSPEDHEVWISERLAQHRSAQGTREQSLTDGRWLRVIESKTSKGGIVGYRLDITDLKNAEAELIHHRDHLEEMVIERTAEVKEKANQLERALEREQEYNVLQQKFVSLVSHEFRTPLSIIDGAAQRLIRRKDKLDPAEVETRANKVRSAVTRMIGLIDTTLYASRLDAGKIDVKIAPCDIGGLLLDVCERQSEISPSHQIKVTIDDLPGEIFADWRLLDQVFSNLLSNAIKYSPDSPLIEVRGWSNGDNALISITDQGLGIPANDLPHMFGRFFRAKTAEGIKGTGIGLNVVKEFVQLQGGSVGVDSLEGEGSTFTVRIPISGAAQ